MTFATAAVAGKLRLRLRLGNRTFPTRSQRGAFLRKGPFSFSEVRGNMPSFGSLHEDAGGKSVGKRARLGESSAARESSCRTPRASTPLPMGIQATACDHRIRRAARHRLLRLQSEGSTVGEVWNLEAWRMGDLRVMREATISSARRPHRRSLVSEQVCGNLTRARSPLPTSSGGGGKGGWGQVLPLCVLQGGTGLNKAAATLRDTLVSYGAREFEIVALSENPERGLAAIQYAVERGVERPLPYAIAVYDNPDWQPKGAKPRHATNLFAESRCKHCGGNRLVLITDDPKTLYAETYAPCKECNPSANTVYYRVDGTRMATKPA